MFRPGYEGLDEAFAESLETVAQIVTDSVDEATLGLKRDLRNQTEAAGLGTKVANTWRSKTFPLRGRSLDPAGYIWSKAPGIADAFDRDPLIVPVRGGRFLAIPSPNVPRTGRYNRRMLPAQVEKAYGQKLTLVPRRNGHILAYVKQVAAPNKRGFSTAKLKLARAGKSVKLVLMFTFVRAVRVGKRIDIDSAAYYWADRAADIAALRF